MPAQPTSAPPTSVPPIRRSPLTVEAWTIGEGPTESDILAVLSPSRNPARWSARYRDALAYGDTAQEAVTAAVETSLGLRNTSQELDPELEASLKATQRQERASFRKAQAHAAAGEAASDVDAAAGGPGETLGEAVTLASLGLE